MDYKVCKQCSIEKTLNKFPVNNGYISSRCAPCTRLTAKIGNPNIDRTTTYHHCNKCSQDKLLIEFYKGRSECKECHRKYKNANKEKIALQKKEYYKENKEYILDRCHKYGQQNPEKVRERNKKYREAHREEIKQYHKEYAEKFPEKIKKQGSDYYQNNKEHIDLKNKKWRENPQNKERTREYSRKSKKQNWDKIYAKEKEYLNTPRGNIDHRMSRGIRGDITNKNKRSWKSLVDYSLDSLVDHLKSFFTEGMTWEKFLTGEIHIDHIFPKNSFQYSTCEEEAFKVCWSLENLRPSWGHDNIPKLDYDPRYYYGENYKEILGLSDDFIAKVEAIYIKQNYTPKLK